MGNHIHFDITPNENESLSNIMQWILSVFAVRYNKIFKYKGHLWYDRFKSKIINDYIQLINTFVYISNNPVRAGLCDHPLHYTYNGITHIMNGNFQIIDEPDDSLMQEIIYYLYNFEAKSAKERNGSLGFYPKNSVK